MIEHHMGLYDSPFKKIQSGTKTIEIRLNDEKRRKISIGDYIIFTKLSEPEKKLTVEVTALYPYSTFKALYEAFSFSEFGCEGYTIQQLLDGTYKIYSKEKEEQCGALGIRIELVDT